MSLIKYPYTNLHELNLDWIIEQLNQEGAVLSVNGKHGTVTLTGEDINRDPNNPQTVEEALTAQGSSIQAQGSSIQAARTLLGTTPLPTTAQTVTGAVDELSGDIGDINEKIGNTALPTTAQTLTGATAELDGDVTTINNKIGNTTLPTTAQTITGAIAEHDTDITTLAANKVNMAVFTKTGVAVPANGHLNVTDTFSITGTVIAVVVLSTPNNAYIFGLASWSSSAVTIGLYNTASSEVSGNVVYGVIYK